MKDASVERFALSRKTTATPVDFRWLESSVVCCLNLPDRCPRTSLFNHHHNNKTNARARARRYFRADDRRTITTIFRYSSQPEVIDGTAVIDIIFRISYHW